MELHFSMQAQGGGPGPAGIQLLFGGAQGRRVMAPIVLHHAHFGPGMIGLGVIAPPNFQQHPAPPPPEAEPPGLPNGGVIDIPCTAMQIENGRGLLGMARMPPGGGGGGQAMQGGGLSKEYEKYIIHQQPDAFSMCAPSEDILLWTSRSGQEITVVNTRLHMITKHHQIRTSPTSTGIVLSRKCVMFTNDNGFVIIISPMDKTFRLVYEYDLRIVINGQILRIGRPLSGRSTHLLDDQETIVHLMAQPPLALYFRVSEIKEAVQRGRHTIVPFDFKNLNNLPSQAIGRVEPVESAIMMLDNRIMLGAPIMNTTHLDWAWFDVKTGQVKTERVFDSPLGEAPQLHPSFTLKLRINPLKLKEIYVHIINPFTNAEQPRERRNLKGELWVMGMSTKTNSFHWKRRERPPSFDDPDFRQLTQTPMDWTRTPEGTMYVRWCDFEGIGPGDENLIVFRQCRSFTLTRVENKISSLTSLACRALQGFDHLSFPLPRQSYLLQLQTQPVSPLPRMSPSDRRRAGVTGVTTAADFLRYSVAHLIHNTAHVYWDDEQVYDDTEELIERQRQAISLMTKKTPFRSIFGTLFSQGMRMDNPVVDLDGPPPISPKKEKEIYVSDDDEEDEEPGPSHRLDRRRRYEESNEMREERRMAELRERRARVEIEARMGAGDNLFNADDDGLAMGLHRSPDREVVDRQMGDEPAMMADDDDDVHGFDQFDPRPPLP